MARQGSNPGPKRYSQKSLNLELELEQTLRQKADDELKELMAALRDIIHYAKQQQLLNIAL